jgi:hypothetical protein
MTIGQPQAEPRNRLSKCLNAASFRDCGWLESNDGPVDPLTDRGLRVGRRLLFSDFSSQAGGPVVCFYLSECSAGRIDDVGLCGDRFGVGDDEMDGERFARDEAKQNRS